MLLEELEQRDVACGDTDSDVCVDVWSLYLCRGFLAGLVQSVGTGVVIGTSCKSNTVLIAVVLQPWTLVLSSVLV